MRNAIIETRGIRDNPNRIIALSSSSLGLTSKNKLIEKEVANPAAKQHGLAVKIIKTSKTAKSLSSSSLGLHCTAQCQQQTQHKNSHGSAMIKINGREEFFTLNQV